MGRRLWETDSGPALYGDWIPHATLRIPAFGRGDERDWFGLGLQVAWHRSIGSRGLFLRDEPDATIEAKLVLSYDYRFGKSGTLRLLVNGDLDEYGTRSSWDGGNGQILLDLEI
jgi:hypothetical protein